MHRYLTATYTVDHHNTAVHKNCSQCQLMESDKQQVLQPLSSAEGHFFLLRHTLLAILCTIITWDVEYNRVFISYTCIFHH
jgi:hypothetical protein